MKLVKIYKDDTYYSQSLNQYLGEYAPATVDAVGNLDILKNKPLAVFSSSKCPGSIILKTYDLMKKIRDMGITVISGFHSPLERECLNVLLKGKQPIIYCPARNIDGMRINPEFKKPLEDGILLILSPFSKKEKRISSERALERNRFIAAIADKILIPHAEPNSKTEIFCRELLDKGKSIATFDNPHNRNILKLGLEVITEDAF